MTTDEFSALDSSYIIKSPHWAPGYLICLCRECWRSWYVPQDKRKRASGWLLLLVDHAEGHTP